MTTIRPDAFPPVPPRPQPRADAKMEAQRAFFAAIAGKSQTAAPAPQASAAPAAESTVRTAASSAEQPQKILRPGSIIDIRV